VHDHPTAEETNVATLEAATPTAPPPTPAEGPGGGGFFARFLRFVEWLGNLLPHPVTLFAIFTVGVLLLSGLAGALGWSVPDPRPEGARGRSANGLIEAVSLLDGNGLRMIVENLVGNFVNFAPLGTVLVAMLGVGVAEKSGLLSAGIRALVLRAPARLLTVAIVFTGVMSNTASEAGYVILVPLAGVIFLAVGRHPIAGMAAAFAGVSGGYSANLLVGTIDPLLAGITQEAAQLLDPGYSVHPAVNYYFMAVSTFLITGLGAWVTDRIVEPQLGRYDASRAEPGVADQLSMEPLSREEKRGLLWAALSVFAVCALLALAVIPEGGVLRNPETGEVLNSPFLRGMVALIFAFFLVPAIVYGRVVGTMKSDRDVIDGMSSAMSGLGLYIVIVFFAAQFVAFFGWTNLGGIVAVKGADFLTAMGMTGPLVFIPFILLCGFINLMIGSASAKWAIVAPVFIPMLMLLGYSPELTQAAYRVGDSVTNIITPMMSYFGLILAFAARFDRKLGIGTIIATMLPYTLVFLVGWTVLFYLWVFALGLPVGPEAPTYYLP
jgi:aminobenzoyl-glutamate transport protein